MNKTIIFIGMLCLAVIKVFAAESQQQSLENLLTAEHRTPEFVLRDKYRHPVETLKFFQVKPEMSVIEIWPGGGWYTELLAPYLKKGSYYAAHFPKDVLPFYDKYLKSYQEKLAANLDIYKHAQLIVFDPKRSVLDSPPGGVDRVLTFRNVHNWLRSESEKVAFNLFYDALKPGGILGVVEHRAKPGTDWGSMKVSGYMTEAYVIQLAEQAGFILDGKSEINSNRRDLADYRDGVWSLPPTLRLQAQDREKYLAIGESDRMTLRFLKPTKTSQ